MERTVEPAARDEAVASGAVASLFVVELTYRRPLGEVDAALDAHVAFLDRQYQAGIFLLSGRMEPRTGGIILARAASGDDLWDILAGDPFHGAGLADYRVTEFVPSRAAPSLAALLAPA